LREKSETPDKTHKLIIDTAIDLMDHAGYDKVTVDMICKSAGIGRSTFYNHFKSIKDVVLERFSIIETILPEQLVWILAAPSGYEKVLRVHLSFINASKGPERVMFYNVNLIHYLTNAGEGNLSKGAYSKQVLTPLIKQAQDNGEIQNMTDPVQLCDAAITLHWGNLFLWCISGGALNRKDAVIKALEALYLPREDLKYKPV
jgi:AcrR family transcriptional regulator